MAGLLIYTPNKFRSV